jgi:hypothetical protein
MTKPGSPQRNLEFIGNSFVRNIPATCMHYLRYSDMLF